MNKTEIQNEIKLCREKLQELEGKLKDADRYHIGQRFIDGEGEEYILAQVDNDKFALIHLIDGNRFSDPVYKMWGASEGLTKEEFEKCCGESKFIRK